MASAPFISVFCRAATDRRCMVVTLQYLGYYYDSGISMPAFEIRDQEVFMKKYKSIILFVLTLLTACLLTGCGREEPQFGVGGYIYVPKAFPQSSDKRNFHIAGDYLYFCEGTENSGAIRRTPLKGEDGIPDLSVGETVLTVGDILSGVPGETLCGGQSFDITGIRDFAVDQEQNLSCIVDFYRSGDAEDHYSVTWAGSMFYRQSADGSHGRCLNLQETTAAGGYGQLAPAGGGKFYVLAGGSLLLVGGEGAVEAGRSPEGCTKLLEGEGGSVYCVMSDAETGRSRTCLLREGLQPEEVQGLSDQSVYSLYGSREGLLLMNSGCLYLYRKASDSLKKILTLSDSSMRGENISEVLPLSEGHLLVRENGVFLLTRTAAEEFGKELIVLASFYVETDLEECVVDFNKRSDKYHVCIETFGADHFNIPSTLEGARARLDSALISKNPPDLLDLSYMDVVKYAEKGVLEDLRNYTEVHPEDYLDGVLEGYTINGRLVCIPKRFVIRTVVGSASRVRSLNGWGMEEVMRLTEEYGAPDYRLLKYGDEYESDYLLGTFCAPYYLERFVDWEEGVCSFDSGEFADILEWAARQAGDGAEGSVPLLDNSWLRNMSRCLVWKLEYPEGAELLGLPTVDKKGVFRPGVDGAVGIVSGSLHREGAWEFLRFYLEEYGQTAEEYTDPGGLSFPTRRDLLEEAVEYAVTPLYSEDGKELVRKGVEYFLIDGEMVETDYYYVEQEQADAVMALIESLDFAPRSSLEDTIVGIVLEEAQSLLNGDKTAAEVSRLIQNRAELALKESR